MIEHWNKKVSENRGPHWNENLVKGKAETRMNPTKVSAHRRSLGYTIERSHAWFKDIFSLSSYTSIENGKRKVKRDVALAISMMYGKKINEFFKPAGKDKYIASRTGDMNGRS